MGNYCSSCGVPVPDGQRICSVCYGDPFYGRDGILLRMMQEAEEEAAREEANRRLSEEQLNGEENG